jgi:nitroreductase
MNRFVGEAPVIVAITAERPNITSRIGAVVKKKPYYLMDIGMAAEHLCLQAAELGLGTCMIGWFDEPEVRALLGVPRGLRVALLVTLGRPADEGAGRETGGGEPRPRQRKDLSRIASRERYGKAW